MFQQAPILTEAESQMFPNLERHSSSANGGRSRTWTYDLAHVRHPDTISNLLNLILEILLEASAGDKQSS